MTTELKPIPLVVQPSNRGSTTDTDARLVNAYIERQPDGSVHVIRRPALRYISTVTPSPASVYNIVGLFNNGSAIYNYTVFFDTVNLTTKLFLAGTDTVGSFLADLTTTIPYDWEFSSNRASPQQILLTAGSRAWWINTFVNTVTELTSWPPAGGVGFKRIGPMVYLDGITFVLMDDGRIWNSNTNDVTTWAGLNFIQVQTDPDTPLAIQKQLTYIVAFKNFSIEFFYNAAKPQGSPLARNDSAKISSVGLFDARSLVRVNDNLVWISQTRLGRRSIHMMEGLQLRQISTPNIDRILEKMNPEHTGEDIFAVGFSVGGHDYYLLSIPEQNIILIYDFISETWAEWVIPTVETRSLKYMTLKGFPISTTDEGPTLYEAASTRTWMITLNYNADKSSAGATATIPVDIYTPLWDQQVRLKKYNAKLEIHGDQKSAGTIQVRTTDDDYQSWGPTRDMNIADGVATSINWGTFRRRGWHIANNENVPFRVTNLIAHISLGSS